MVGDDILDYGKSSAAIKSKFIQTLREKFEERADGADVSNLNAGIIGVTLDFIANAIEDQYFNVNSRSKEIFPTAAKFDDSVYLHATVAHIHDFFAKPSKIEILFAIPVKDIKRKAIPYTEPGNLTRSYSMLTLSENTVIGLDRFRFKLDYPINIIVQPGLNETSKSISCSYDMTTKNPYSDIQAPLMIGKTQFLDGIEYFIFKTPVRQLIYEKRELTYVPNIATADIYTFSFEGQLAGFEVLYKRNNDQREWMKLNKLYLGTLMSSGNPFCYYRLMDDNTFTISFSNDPRHWSPEFNSRLRIDIFTTEGKAGNFTFTGDQILKELSQDSENKFENAFSGIIPYVEILNKTASDGKDKPTLDELRLAIVDYKSSRHLIVSDEDLRQYLESYGVQSVKQRDDIFNREFMAYTLLEDTENKFVIPSRTGDIYVNEKKETLEMEGVDARFLNPNNVYQFWLADDPKYFNFTRYIISPSDSDGKSIMSAMFPEKKRNTRGEDIPQVPDWTYIYDKYMQYDGILMMCPYFIKIFKDPYFVSLYDVQCDTILGTSFVFSNSDSPEKFAISKITITRESIMSNVYVIKTEVSLSDMLMQEFLLLGPYDLDRFKVRVKLELLDDKKRTYGYINAGESVQANSSGTKLIFTSYLETDNCLHNDDMFRIIGKKIFPTGDDQLKDIGTTVNPDRYFIPFRVYLRAHVAYSLYDYKSTKRGTKSWDYILRKDEIEDGFVVTDVFDIPEQFYFIRDVSNSFSTALEVIATPPVWPVYAENVPAYRKVPIYEYEEDGTIKMDPSDPTQPFIKPGNRLGDPVMDEHDQQVNEHLKGDLKILYDPTTNKPIYEVESENAFIIKRLPMISMMALLNPYYKDLIYNKLKSLTDVIHKTVLPQLVQNSSIHVGLYNTVGPSMMFIQGFGDVSNYTNLPKLNLSITLNCRLNDPEMSESLRNPISRSAMDYLTDSMKSGKFTMDGLLVYLKTQYPDINYIEFESLNGAETKVQTIKGADKTAYDSKAIPEYVTVNQKIDEGKFKADGTVEMKADININMLSD